MSKTKRINPKVLVCKAADSIAEMVKNTQLTVAHHFPTAVYLIDRPDFLETVTQVSQEALEKVRAKQPVNEIYPLVMSGNYFDDPRLDKFAEFIGGTAWNILTEQGYSMQDKVVQFTEMWTQEHYKHSAMDQHVHAGGSQIVGFYFLETPENCSNVVFHDPRSGKVQIDLPEQDAHVATAASKMINFTPKPGTVIFANSWLAHSFSRHAAEEPIRFVHFNLTVIPTPVSISITPAEVI